MPNLLVQPYPRRIDVDRHVERENGRYFHKPRRCRLCSCREVDPFLKEAIGVPSAAIFCSSVDGHGIPLGDDFNEYIKKQIQKPKLVILLMTPRYMYQR